MGLSLSADCTLNQQIRTRRTVQAVGWLGTSIHHSPAVLNTMVSKRYP